MGGSLVSSKVKSLECQDEGSKKKPAPSVHTARLCLLFGHAVQFQYIPNNLCTCRKAEKKGYFFEVVRA